MATRFYFGQLLSTTVPAFSATWSAPGSTPQRALMRTVKRQAALSTAPFVNTSSETTASILNKLNVQLISMPLAAQTITGTVKGYALFSESDTAQDCRVQCEIRIIAPDGTVRGTLLTADAGALSSEFVTTPTNRRIPLLAATNTLTSVAAQAGDFLVVEIGHRTHSASGTTYNVTLRWHDDPATGDLPEDETTTTTTLAPWIEFSQTLILNDKLDALQADGPAFLGTKDLVSFPVDDMSSVSSADTLLEFMTFPLAQALTDRIANQAGDNVRPTYIPQNIVNATSTAIFDDVGVQQFGLSTFGTDAMRAFSLDDAPFDQSYAALAEFNTQPLNYNLVGLNDRTIEAGELIPGSATTYTNRVFDSVAGKFVKWSTHTPDSAGVQYPGPGTFGVTTSDYVISGICAAS